MKRATAHVPLRSEKLLFAMDDGELPPEREPREQRLQRILAGPLGRVLKPASELSFTPRNAIRASVRAHRGNVAAAGETGAGMRVSLASAVPQGLAEEETAVEDPDPILPSLTGPSGPFTYVGTLRNSSNNPLTEVVTS